MISLSESLRPKFRSEYILRPKLSKTNWLKSVEFAWKSLSHFLTFAQPKFKSKVELNFGLSPDFSVELKVSLSESLSERLSQKLKWPILLYTTSHNVRNIFTARCTLVQSAVLRSHVVCLSVCPSVCPSVCDVGGLWSHRLEFFENNFTVS